MRPSKSNPIFLLMLFLCGLQDVQARGIMEFTPSIPEFRFQLIESGWKTFMMGSHPLEKNRRVNENGENGERGEVTFKKVFQITITEVTQQQWFDVMGENPSFYKKKEFCPDRGNHKIKRGNNGEMVKLCPNHPVEQVSWDMVQEFIKTLNELAGISGCEGTPGDPAGCFRLPTEAEWEYAARGGTSTAYSFDLQFIDQYAWYKENSENQVNYTNGQPYAVGQKLANPYGLFDMHGNVWEWTQDSWRDFLVGETDPLSDTAEEPFPFRAVRGGGFDNEAQSLRSAYRRGFYQEVEYVDTGLRLVKTL
ncbi:MAG: formylglycine-generating enzyme family protein [Halobacteriovoraceae bacterium]|nr:formylglycine-generating enzyme family protein [Halobacteriovoraceae bacterium]